MFCVSHIMWPKSWKPSFIEWEEKEAHIVCLQANYTPCSCILAPHKYIVYMATFTMKLNTLQIRVSVFYQLQSVQHGCATETRPGQAWISKLVLMQVAWRGWWRNRSVPLQIYLKMEIKYLPNKCDTFPISHVCSHAPPPPHFTFASDVGYVF